MWTVIYSPTAADWVAGLGTEDFAQVRARVEMLKEHGPGLGRPIVDSIKGSRHTNMKELRAGTIRALFIFDPERRAVILVGGDKRGDWSKWYKKNIPVADDLYDAYLKENA